MGKTTTIQWAEATHNFWEGCKKVSQGCKYCYAARGFEKYGKNFDIVRRTKGFYSPLKWKEPKLIFTCSTSDFFVDKSDQWRDEAWDVIKRTPHHTYQILTKRPERIIAHLPGDWEGGYSNVWLGVSVESQPAAEHRIPLLKSVPAKVKFLSCEPLLSELFMGSMLDGIDWVIVGGESGNDNGKYLYRPCSIQWIHHIIADCKFADIPVFVKQLGTFISKELQMKDRHGGDILEFPTDLRIREFPLNYKK